jgi:hypothetical protein
MESRFLGLATDQGLLNKLRDAASHRPSASDILEQRVSFAYSSVKPSSGVTRERVRQVIIDQDGGARGVAK